jgi:hypothetical protein
MIELGTKLSSKANTDGSYIIVALKTFKNDNNEEVFKIVVSKDLQLIYDSGIISDIATADKEYKEQMDIMNKEKA